MLHQKLQWFLTLKMQKRLCIETILKFTIEFKMSPVKMNVLPGEDGIYLFISNKYKLKCAVFLF